LSLASKKYVASALTLFTYTVQNVGGLITTVGAIAGSILALFAAINKMKKGKEHPTDKREGAPISSDTL
jgi:hypothetical protein